MIEISQSAREAVQALSSSGLIDFGLHYSLTKRLLVMEIIQLAIERETKELRDNAWKYEMLGR